MSGELLYSQAETLIALGLLGFLFTAGEVGYRVGRRRRASIDEATRSQIGTIEGGILALLGLLLAFTFSMAVSRFDARKQLVVAEANAIGTAILRGRLLPQPHRSEVADLFRQYLDVRLEASRAGLPGEPVPGPDERAARLQERLWSQAAGAAEKDARAVTTGLFIQSLNEVIDIKEKRKAALNNHVPTSALFLLVGVAALSVALVGYECGLGASRPTVEQMILSLLITLVILVILDFDRPQGGLIRVGETSMIDLKESLRKAPW